MLRSILVTGTDTGIGKTFVTAGLARACVRRGMDVGVMKPFATGARRVGRRLISDDARILRSAAGVDDPLEEINPVCLRLPLAPRVAARQEGKRIDLGRVLLAYRGLSKAHPTLLVEGVGGLLVPLSTGFTVAHFARRLRLPLLIVARPSLGTINHSALTVHVARSFGLPILGFVVNAAEPSRRGLAERLNPRTLEEETGVPVLAELPHLRGRLLHPFFDRLLLALNRSAASADL